MTNRAGGKTGYNRTIQKREQAYRQRLQSPISKPPLQSKAELRRIADEAINKWIREHHERQP